MITFLSALFLSVSASSFAQTPPSSYWSTYAAKLPPVPIATAEHPYEYVLLCGGPSLMRWEKFKEIPHDLYWGCFVRAARTRVQQLRMQIGENPYAKITLLIYLDSYRSRSQQENKNLISDIYSIRDKYHIQVVPIQTAQDAIDYLNQGEHQDRTRVKIADFEYFGHSNSCAFMFDYSNNIDSASKAWLHEDSLKLLRRDLFVKNSYVKSWGCHTGESMSKKFYKATGMHMIGAVGRTDFSTREEALNGIIPSLSSAHGKWVR